MQTPSRRNLLKGALLPVAGVHEDYAASVKKQLEGAGLRADIYDSAESLGKRIREGEKQKVPFLRREDRPASRIVRRARALPFMRF